MLSKRERRGLAPNSSYELGRGLRRVLAPSTSLWNRPRGGAACIDPLAASKAAEPVAVPEMERVLTLRSLDEVCSTESDWEEEGGFKELGEGACSPETAHGNGMATKGSVSSPFVLSTEPVRLGTYTPFLCPAIPVRALLRRSATRPVGARPEPSLPVSGLESRGSKGSLNVSNGVSTL
jgi:hypothetical protein